MLEAVDCSNNGSMRRASYFLPSSSILRFININLFWSNYEGFSKCATKVDMAMFSVWMFSFWLCFFFYVFSNISPVECEEWKVSKVTNQWNNIMDDFYRTFVYLLIFKWWNAGLYLSDNNHAGISNVRRRWIWLRSPSNVIIVHFIVYVNHVSIRRRWWKRNEIELASSFTISISLNCPWSCTNTLPYSSIYPVVI